MSVISFQKYTMEELELLRELITSAVITESVLTGRKRLRTSVLYSEYLHKKVILHMY